MTEFKVGDRVRHATYGLGTVKGHDNMGWLAIEAEANFFDHDCGGKTAHNMGVWLKPYTLKPVRPTEVGQKVRIADKPSQKYFYNAGFNGKIGIVAGIVDGGKVFDVVVKALGFPQFVPVADLTLIHEDPVEAVIAATPKPKVRTFQKGSQCSRILSYLLRGSSITPIKARSLFGTERLAARILELKQGGHKVISTIRTDENGKVYAEYSLRATNRFGNKVAA